MGRELLVPVICGIHIGGNAAAGANSGIVDWVEDNRTVVGIPARKVRNDDIEISK